MRGPTDIYLQKARAKHRTLRRRAEHLPAEARPFATDVLAELSLACTMLESETRWPSGERIEPAAVMREPGERLLEIVEEAEFFRGVAEDLPTGLAVVGSDGLIVYINPAGLRSLGFRREQLVEHSAFDLIHPEDVPAARRDFERLIGHPERVAGDELRVRQEDGSWVRIRMLGKRARESSPVDGLIVTSVAARQRRERPRRLSPN